MKKNNTQHYKSTSILPRQNKSQGGFLELIVIILIALILLRFLEIDINAFLTKEWVKEFIGYSKEMLIQVWQDMVTIFYAIKGS